MQTDGFGAEQRYKTMRDCFAQTYRGEGRERVLEGYRADSVEGHAFRTSS
ncbi:hypothetical protein CGLO_16675 [Colletotrichum gloeosporioides Cg-14]|uniref:Uncharacterized protein n=1 Tax=Colletotrichum gloeosporioides (strain Cg-14) TaxID=1237896 RepID=T0JYL0_COLGC|nr:hypothetical protein CGLO_16675 [Colletotrichum gloeosporioides Cg-14]